MSLNASSWTVTLISASKLRTMVYEEPINRNKGLDIFEEPIEDHYVISVDVPEGLPRTTPLSNYRHHDYTLPYGCKV